MQYTPIYGKIWQNIKSEYLQLFELQPFFDLSYPSPNDDDDHDDDDDYDDDDNCKCGATSRLDGIC